MTPDTVVKTTLPENAYRELKPGEVYEPMVPARADVPEVTVRSIVFGIVMNVIFSAAASYLALKVGQGIETAIPISILAVGLSGFLAKFGSRRSSLLENVNVLAISTTSGIVAGGTVFTMPAIYILGLDKSLGLGNTQLFLQIFLVPFLGAILGVIFLVPFRNYYVKLMHGKLPFPEATATNEILATGAATESGGQQAWVLIYSFVIAMIYNFLYVGMKLFNETFTTGIAKATLKGKDYAVDAFPGLSSLTHRAKAVFSLDTSAAFLGLGYIIGLRYATIIVCGSFLSCFAIVPLLAGFDLPTLQTLNPSLKDNSATGIFFGIPRIIGIGGIFTAGLISIVKMSGVIVTALRQAISSLFQSDADERRERTDQDISYSTLFILGIGTIAAIFVYFRYFVMDSTPHPWRFTAFATFLAVVLAFLFTTVSAWAIAMISTTPLSGMTVTTIIITAAALLAVGLPKGDKSMLAVLLVGGIVCTALSMAGTMVTQFKIGYWMGSTPRTIEWGAILSSLLASVLVTLTVMVLAYKPGFVQTELTPNPLQAPQANMMKSTLESFLGTGAVPWRLYGIGAVLALIVNFLKISPLAFMLGMYLPMGINTPILLGAIVAALAGRGSATDPRTKARNDKGILVASGLIAGAAIIDVLTNGLAILDEKFFGDKVMAALDMSRRLAEGRSPEDLTRTINLLGLLMFLGLCLFAYVDCRRAKPSGPALQH
jgi:putative OPT family oligopeptide transporter